CATAPKLQWISQRNRQGYGGRRLPPSRYCINRLGLRARAGVSVLAILRRWDREGGPRGPVLPTPPYVLMFVTPHTSGPEIRDPVGSVATDPYPSGRVG